LPGQLSLVASTRSAIDDMVRSCATNVTRKKKRCRHKGQDGKRRGVTHVDEPTNPARVPYGQFFGAKLDIITAAAKASSPGAVIQVSIFSDVRLTSMRLGRTGPGTTFGSVVRKSNRSLAVGGG
jgi:hypothetical protein